MSDTLIIGGKTYSGVPGIKAIDSGDNELTFVRPTGTKQISITENGTVTEDVAAYANAEISVNVQGGGGGDENLQAALITGVFDKDYTIPATTIGRAFANCIGEYNISFPNVTTLRVTSFTFEKSQFASINLPKLTGNVGDSFRLFKGDHIYAPKITTAGIGVFDSCSNLLDAFYPEFTTPVNAFNACTKLEKAVCGYTGNSYYQFKNCSSLLAVDFCKGGNKIDNTFNGCTKLKTLVLRSQSTLPLTNLSAFDNTPFASGGTGGTLYVPQALIASYEAATNWSTILGYANNSIAAIEGSQYENYYADGTPIT